MFVLRENKHRLVLMFLVLLIAIQLYSNTVFANTNAGTSTSTSTDSDTDTDTDADQLSRSTSSSTEDTNPEPNFRIGVGVAQFSVPSFPGADTHETVLIPNLEMRYKSRLNFSFLSGINYDFFEKDPLGAGLALDFNRGRDQPDALPGFEKIDSTLEAGVFAEYTLNDFTARIKVLHGVGGHEGTTVQGLIQHAKLYQTKLIPLFVVVRPTVKLADSQYLNAFYGVGAAQSQSASLTEYTPRAGLLSYGFDFVLIVPLSRQAFIRNFALVEFLAGDAADSPIVKDIGNPMQRTLGIELAYFF